MKISDHLAARRGRLTLSLVAIYGPNQVEHPGRFVVRPWYVVRGRSLPGTAHLAPSLEEARGLVPPGRVRVSRHEADDVSLVETWV